METPLLGRALDLAVRAHRNQRRQGGKIPYVVHPLRVVGHVHHWGLTRAEVLAAAALHDTVEDTPVTLDELRRDFGNEVAELVDRLTHPNGLKPRERTRIILQQLEDAPLEAVVIKLADRLDNAKEMPWRARSRVGYLGEAEDIGHLAERRMRAAPPGPARDALARALPDYRGVILAKLAEAQRDLAAEKRRPRR